MRRVAVVGCAGVVVWSLLSGGPSNLLAQDLSPVGTEFQVNSFTPNPQFTGAVGMDGQGDFVVTWNSLNQDNDNSRNGVFGRRFDLTGEALAVEFQINVFTVGDQLDPDVAVASAGQFVVVWVSEPGAAPAVDERGGPVSITDIIARRFDGNGVGLGTEFQVSLDSASQARPAVAAESDGDFIVVWDVAGSDGAGRGVFARRFNSSGVALAEEFQVNTHTLGNQLGAAVAVRDASGFVVSWSSDHDGSDTGVFARRFDASGVGVASEFQVNSFTQDDQTAPAVALGGDGAFVIAWTSSAQDGNYFGVFAQRFDSSGVPKGDEFQVPLYTVDTQTNPQVEMKADGRFLVVWSSSGQDGAFDGIFARRFDETGAPSGGEFQVNTHTEGSERIPVVANVHGRTVVAWAGEHDDGNLGVFAQRYLEPAILDIDANGQVGPLTDGLLVLRYMFGFKGATLTSGVIDTVGCERCDAAEIEAYLATLI